jgi:hypothetical protein
VAAKQPEGKIKTKCRAIAKLAYLIFWNIEGKSLNGVPDTLCSRVRGGVVLVEFKVPGKAPTEQQYLRIWELREQGIEAWWATSVEEWERIVGLKPGGYEVFYPLTARENIRALHGEDAI